MLDSYDLRKRFHPCVLVLLCGVGAWAQEPQTRADLIRRARQRKAQDLRPEKPSKIEQRLLGFNEKAMLSKAGRGSSEGFSPGIGGVLK